VSAPLPDPQPGGDGDSDRDAARVGEPVRPPAGWNAANALARTHEWFAHNSGWAPPDDETLAEWRADNMCRAPDECLVFPGRWCRHGLASWDLILHHIDDG
jgi:hypothetical protein